MDKKLVLLFLAFSVLATSESWRRWPAARAIRRVARKVGRFAHRAVRQVARVVTKPLKSVKKCYRTGVKAVHGIRRFLGDGGADQHTIESLRKLREQDPDTYQAAMMVVADELVLEMTQEEAERQLQSMDFLISGENSMSELEQQEVAKDDGQQLNDLLKTMEEEEHGGEPAS